MIVLKLRL